MRSCRCAHQWIAASVPSQAFMLSRRHSLPTCEPTPHATANDAWQTQQCNLDVPSRARSCQFLASWIAAPIQLNTCHICETKMKGSTRRTRGPQQMQARARSCSYSFVTFPVVFVHDTSIQLDCCFHAVEYMRQRAHRAQPSSQPSGSVLAL